MLNSVTIVFWKETLFPLVKTRELWITKELWNREVVSSAMEPVNLSVATHAVPCTSCLRGKCTEDASDGQFAIFIDLVMCCLMGCCTMAWMPCCRNVTLRICVSNSHISCHGFSLVGERSCLGIHHRLVTAIRQFNCCIWNFLKLGESIDAVKDCLSCFAIDLPSCVCKKGASSSCYVTIPQSAAFANSVSCHSEVFVVF